MQFIAVKSKMIESKFGPKIKYFDCLSCFICVYQFFSPRKVGCGWVGGGGGGGGGKFSVGLILE